jgi:hypothetical protein
VKYVAALAIVAVSFAAPGCGGSSTSGAPAPWVLETHHAGSAATMTTLSDPSGAMHVAIARAEEPTPFNVQLNQSGYNLRSGEEYILSFRAKAERPRDIAVGISMAHEPWEGLGYYRQRPIGTDWTTIEDAVTLTKADPNARIHFDLGADTAAMDIDAVTLRTKAGAVVAPHAPNR